MEEVLQVANEFGVWILAGLVVSIALVQAILYYKLSFKAGEELGIPKEDCKAAFKTGVITSIGPSFAVFVIMVGLMSVIGGPMAWMRLAVIGSAPAELTAAQIGANAYNADFGGAGYDLTAMSVGWWTMAINGAGWLLFVGFFAHKLEKLRDKVAGGDKKWLAVLSGGAMLGVFGYLNAGSVLALGGEVVAVVVGAVAMIVLLKISEHYSVLKEYSLGLAMLVGMFAAVLLG
ncbi:DUF5058 family protein [Natroniella sulfidigena]|uniref:DUF5058 family protein n=1 Tax=Natroniella sulfidigena TaxID=723921 RepID=UPI00200B60DA|nr:DUF5058 family protein [Natroniella sulfidigena]MCK8817839.1 DUF5058 family protein [Natroniella sulfidigena]